MKAAVSSSADKCEDQSSRDIIPITSAPSISCIQKRRHNVSDQSAEVLENADLLGRILANLTAKMVFGFTLVSRHWNEVITDPQLKCLLKVPRNPTAVFIRRVVLSDDDSVKFTHIPLERVSGGGAARVRRTTVTLNLFQEERFAHVPFVINHSGNGLMICCSDHPICYFLYNPTTKNRVEIPQLTADNFRVISMHISFQAPGTYKLITVCFSKKINRPQLLVLEPNQSLLQWRNTEVEFPARSFEVVNYEYGIYMDGEIYWPCYESSGLMFFNVREETVQWLPEVPQPYNNFSEIVYFGECKGNLRMVLNASIRGATFDMLELKTDRSMWFIKYHIDLTQRARGAMIIPILVLALLPGEEDDDSYLIVHILKEVVSYNLRDGTIRKLCNLGLRPIESICLRDEPWYYVHPYLQNPIDPTL